MNRDLSALSFWFPKIQAAGLPVPNTILLDMPEEAAKAVWAALDGGNEGNILPFCEAINKAVLSVGGYPSFLRTDHTSAKHSWARSCYIQRPEDIPSHIIAIAEFSVMADFMGLAFNRWAVREYLPVKPVTVCPHYNDMPVNREFRFFVDDGKVRCWHPYWPEGALKEGGAPSHLNLEYLYRMDDEAALRELASKAGLSVGGSWSVDLLETERGWFVTDMAVAAQSFHWAGCPLSDATPQPKDTAVNPCELIQRIGGGVDVPVAQGRE